MIDSHSYLLQEHFGSELPTEQTPVSFHYPSKTTLKDKENQARIAETIERLKTRSDKKSLYLRDI